MEERVRYVFCSILLYPGSTLSLETCLGSFHCSDLSRSSLALLKREILTLKSQRKRKECSRSYNGDTFCFELGNTPDPHDYYYFNRQKRGLPNTNIRGLLPEQCAALCRDKVGGKAVASECKFRSTPSLIEPLVFAAQDTSRERFQSPIPVLYIWGILPQGSYADSETSR